MSDADQCSSMASEAAAAAIRHNGVRIEIKLLCADGYRLWTWAGKVPETMVMLAAVPVVGGEQ